MEVTDRRRDKKRAGTSFIGVFVNIIIKKNKSIQSFWRIFKPF